MRANETTVYTWRSLSIVQEGMVALIEHIHCSIWSGTLLPKTPFLPLPLTISFTASGTDEPLEIDTLNWIKITTKAPSTKPSATARRISLEELWITGSGFAPHSQWHVTKPASCFAGFQVKLLIPMPTPAMKIPLRVSGSMRKQIPPGSSWGLITAASFVKLHLIVVTSYWSYIFILREPQHTPGAYPRHPQKPTWKEILHELLVGGWAYWPLVSLNNVLLNRYFWRGVR